MSANPPVAVQAHGQSIWYDNIQRGLLHNGELKHLIERYGVTGVTSNPAIFQKAIGESDDYNDALLHLLDEEPNVIYEHLAIADIQQVADLLRPIYDQTQCRDGYVSLEVSPLIAHDTETTVSEAKRLFAAVDRPNLMIKIPATSAGIPAIEACIAAGLNINVTLIFSVQNYLDVAESYIRGLETRLAAGHDISRVASVASFFVSRIDTLVDHMLENNIRAALGRDVDRVSANRQLLGLTAIANARLAYKHFLSIFRGERFAALEAAGAQVQRPLWASTGTKNPAYTDTRYVDELIAADTVNTVPPATLAAFIDHGKTEPFSLDTLDTAENTLHKLSETGIELALVTQQLQADGVDAFIEAFENLLDQVDAKRNVLRAGVIQRQDAVLGIYADAVQDTIERLDKAFINMRLWEKDGSIWHGSSSVINAMRNRLGWLDVEKTIDRARLEALQQQAGQWAHVVVLGMGGSSLAPLVFAQTFGQTKGYPQLHVLDSTHPAAINALIAQLDIARTLFIVSSKSGTTLETRAFFDIFYALVDENGQQFIAITDADTPLATLAQTHNFRDCFLNPADIGGRYSALSYFGLVPAALLGVDLKRLWHQAQQMLAACGPRVSSADHPGIWLGVVMGELAQQGRDKISILTSPSIKDFGLWAEQLIAESTGKNGKGTIPVAGATVGLPHDYVSDRLFIYLRVEGDDNAALDEGILALQQASHPCLTLRLDDVYALGGEFFRWEYATAIAGHIININPFDEPNVTESKEYTARLLESCPVGQGLPLPTAALTEDCVSLSADEKTLRLLSELSLQHQYDSGDILGLLAAQINATSAGDYFALLAYLPEEPETHALLELIRRRLRHTTRRAVTVGYGPRYLHSTGQLHKGGPNNGVYFLITSDYLTQPDISIPGSSYSANTLNRAQALGDIQALQAHRRRVVHLHISGNLQEGLSQLLAAIDAVEARRR